MLTPDNLESLARVARKYQIPIIKITSGQRFALVGMKKEDFEEQPEMSRCFSDPDPNELLTAGPF